MHVRTHAGGLRHVKNRFYFLGSVGVLGGGGVFIGSVGVLGGVGGVYRRVIEGIDRLYRGALMSAFP